MCVCVCVREVPKLHMYEFVCMYVYTSTIKMCGHELCCCCMFVCMYACVCVCVCMRVCVCECECLFELAVCCVSTHTHTLLNRPSSSLFFPHFPSVTGSTTSCFTSSFRTFQRTFSSHDAMLLARASLWSCHRCLNDSLDMVHCKE